MTLLPWSCSPVPAPWDINDRQRHGRDMAVFKKHAGTFHLVPVVDGPIGVAHEVGRGVVGESPYVQSGCRQWRSDDKLCGRSSC